MTAISNGHSEDDTANEGRSCVVCTITNHANPHSLFSQQQTKHILFIFLSMETHTQNERVSYSILTGDIDLLLKPKLI